MLFLYRFITGLSAPILEFLLRKRIAKGKEDPDRIAERRGVASIGRPKTRLGYVHAASVGEAQSTLILINRLLHDDPDLHILVTTGTRSSAELMKDKLPDRAFHQFAPLDHPIWVKSFLDYWQPDFVLWIESELWPNMLASIKSREIPTILVNARLSDRSFKRWCFIKSSARNVLSTFALVLTQTESDLERFSKLAGKDTEVKLSGNLKYSAKALPCDEDMLKELQGAAGTRPTWVYASSHKGEETLVCRVHAMLRINHPDLLSIIVPRHPERRDDIIEQCSSEDGSLSLQLRGQKREIIKPDTDIYIADTLGELGLFYRLAPIALIGRSFSDDGGGGHNPIEAAQLHCAVLYGPNVQYQKEIFNDMNSHEAAICVQSEEELTAMLSRLINETSLRENYQAKAYDFAQYNEGVIERVWEAINPLIAAPLTKPKNLKKNQKQKQQKEKMKVAS